MASQISVYVAPGVKPARFYAGRFLDALHKEFDKYKSITLEIDDGSSHATARARTNRTSYLRSSAASSMNQSLTATMLRDTQSLTWRYVVRNKILMV